MTRSGWLVRDKTTIPLSKIHAYSLGNCDEPLLSFIILEYIEGRSSVFEEDQGEDALYHLHIFLQYAETWLNHRLGQGLFVLVYGDMETLNLLVNENMLETI
ncbi:hypothetical protein ACMFMF_010326 [Clarireedia jacksonii]